MNPIPITLEGTHVRLEPLALAHAEDLYAAGRDDATWRYMPRPALRSAEDARAMIEEALVQLAQGEQVPFAIVDRASARAIGSTRFIDIRRPHRGLEIGWTWIARDHQRTRANTQAKRLLLAHAFEELGAMRVQLKTDARNEASQRAIERLGAVREGVLRRHFILWDGFVRDTVMYSITDHEWPGVRARLAAFELRV